LGAPLLRGLSREERARVLKAAASRRLRSGEALFHQDDPANALHLVLEGRIRLTQVTAEGREVIVRLAGPGAVFAAIAVLEGTTYPFDATATQASRLQSWERGVLRELFRHIPRLEQNVTAIVASHSREMLDRLRELSTEPVPQRLVRTLLRLAESDGRPQAEGVLVDGITRLELAELSGTTLFSVSRLLSEWQAQRLVQCGRGRVLIRDRRGLERLRRVPPGSAPRDPTAV